MNARQGTDFKKEPPPCAPCARYGYAGGSVGQVRERIAREMREASEMMVATALFSPNGREVWKKSEGASGMHASVDLPALNLAASEIVAIVGGLVSAAGFAPAHMKIEPAKDASGSPCTNVHITNADFDPARVWDAYKKAQQMKEADKQTHGAKR